MLYRGRKYLWYFLLAYDSVTILTLESKGFGATRVKYW